MKKSFLYPSLAAVCVLGGTHAKAQTITNYIPGDVVVERIGDGSTALTSAGTAVFLDEYNPITGTLDGTQALSGLATPLVDSGTATSDGQLTRSDNGQFLVVPGYDAAVGTTGVTGATSTAVPREVATVSSTGAVIQTTINAYSANNIRSASSEDGTTIYTAGQITGVLAVTSGAQNATPTTISSTSVNNRDVVVAGGNLYVSSQSGTTFRIAQVGTGLPTTTGQTATEVPGITATTATPAGNVNAPNQFKAVTLTLGSTTVDTFYVADTGANALEKFSLTGSTFTLTGTAALTGVYGLAVRNIPGGEQIVASTPTGLYALTDASGAGGTLTATFGTAFATAATNEVFRGDAFAPTAAAVPEPSTYVLLVAGGLGLLAMARRGVSRTQA